MTERADAFGDQAIRAIGEKHRSQAIKHDSEIPKE